MHLSLYLSFSFCLPLSHLCLSLSFSLHFSLAPSLFLSPTLSLLFSSLLSFFFSILLLFLSPTFSLSYHSIYFYSTSSCTRACVEVARQLYQCCANGDHATLTQLLNTERYAVQLIEATNKADAPKAIVEKTIYTACLRGHYAVVRILLRRNINVNMNSGFGTPIYAAAKCGSLDVVKLLIEYGAEYKRVRSGFSPLFVACVEGQLNILRYLVNVGADLYSFSNPPLVFTACMQGHLQVLQYLMEEMEYDIHRTVNGENALRMDGKDSLLYVACCRSKIDVADYLLTKGAIITQLIATKFSSAVKQLLEKRIRQSHRPSKPGSPPNITARWKELGLAEIPWAFIATYSHKITKLELRSNRLSSLPEQIFQMPHLKTLDVSQNLLPELTQEDVDWHCYR